MTILSPTSFLKWLLICTMHTEVLHKPEASVGLFGHLIIPLVHLAYVVFPSILRTRLGLPHPLVLKLTHLHLWLVFTFCNNSPFLLFPWRGMDYILQCSSIYLHLHCKRHKFSCFAWANPCPSTPFLLVFSLTSWHCVISWWHLLFG
jgi:hypothetical protein